MSNIILCGFKSCGKSTLAKKIAEKTGLHYIDTDLLVSKNCRECYRNEGQEAFREMERQVVEAIQEFQNSVIATGGGTVLDPENVAILKKLGKVIYLRVPKEELKKRLLSAPLPAYLDPNHPEDSFEQMYQIRAPIYEAVADFIVDSEEQIWEFIE